MRKTTQQLAIEPDALIISENRAVSDRSIWSDPVWRLNATRPGAFSRGDAIYWPADVDPAIVEQFKILLWGLYVEPRARGFVEAATVAVFTSAVRVLARYMQKWDCADFEELTPEFFGQLLDDIKIEVSAIDALEYEDAVDEEEIEDRVIDTAQLEAPVASSGEERASSPFADTRLTFSAMYAVMRLVRVAYDQRAVLQKLGAAAPQADPLEGAAPYEVAQSVRAVSSVPAGSIPDEVATPLMHATYRLFAETSGVSPARDVLRLQNIYFDAVARAGRHGKSVRARIIDDALAGFKFSTLPGESSPWHPGLPIDLETGGGPQSATITLRNLVVMMRDAGLLHLIQFAALRIGEATSLQAGRDEDTGLPLCVSKSRSISGALDLFHVSGLTKKGRTAPDNGEWLVGAVPAGTDYLPTTVQALTVLEELMRPHRALSDDPLARNSLAVSINTPGMPANPNGVLRLTTHRLARSIAQLYRDLINFSALPDVSRSGMSLLGIKQTQGRYIRLVLWRKTFATSVISIDSEAMHAIKQQFKHIAIATTEGAYVGSDTGLLEQFDDSRMNASMRFMRERAAGLEAHGRGGKIVSRLSDRLRRMMDDESAARERLAHMGSKISDAPHGSCAIFISPQRAECHALGGTPSFLQSSPKHGLRSPTVCSRCRNFVLEPKHKPYWRERFLTNNQSKRDAERNGSVAAAWQFADRAKHAIRVLKSTERRIRRESGKVGE